MAECKCKTCTRDQRYMRIANKLPPKDKEFLEDVLNYLACIELDLECMTAVLEGNWPSSVQQLTAALKVAKEKKKIWEK